MPSLLVPAVGAVMALTAGVLWHPGWFAVAAVLAVAGLLGARRGRRQARHSDSHPAPTMPRHRVVPTRAVARATNSRHYAPTPVVRDLG